MGNESIAIVILFALGLLGLIIAIKVTTSAARVSKKGITAGLKKSKQAASYLSRELEIQRERILQRKLKEVVAEEYIRELVRSAMKKGIDPSLSEVCAECKGSGCSYCQNKGWLSK